MLRGFLFITVTMLRFAHGFVLLSLSFLKEGALRLTCQAHNVAGGWCSMVVCTLHSIPTLHSWEPSHLWGDAMAGCRTSELLKNGAVPFLMVLSDLGGVRVLEQTALWQLWGGAFCLIWIPG